MRVSDAKPFFVGSIWLLAAIAVAQPKITIPIGHSEGILHGSFSPNGDYILTASEDNTTKLWETESGKLIRTLEGHTKPITSSTFSMDGKTIITTSQDGLLKGWETLSGNLLYTIRVGSYINGIALSPDNKSMVVFSHDVSATLLDVTTGKQIHVLTGHTKSINSASFNQTGTLVVTASNDRTARIWDTQSGLLRLTLTGHTDFVNTARFHPDGMKIVTASDDTQAKIWDATSAKTLATLAGHTAAITSAFFDEAGDVIVTAARDQTVKMWNGNGNLLHTLQSHTQDVLGASFSMGGKYLLTFSDDGTTKIWQAATGKLLRSTKAHTEGVTSATFSHDARFYLTTSHDKTAKVWDTNTGKLFRLLVGKAQRLEAVQVSATGKYLGVKTFSQQPIWEAASGRGIHAPNGSWRITNNEEFLVEYGNPPRWHGLPQVPPTFRLMAGGTRILHINAGTFINKTNERTRLSQDNSLLASVQQNNVLTCVNVSTSTPLLEIRLAAQPNSVEISRDNKYICVAFANSVEVLDITNKGALVHTLPHTGLSGAALSDDSRFILTNGNGAIQIWELNSGKRVSSLKPPRYSTEATFSPNGEHLVTHVGIFGGSTTPIAIWKTNTGQLVKMLPKTEGLKALCFSQDSKLLFTSHHSVINSWEVASGNLVFNNTNPQHDYMGVTITPDAKHIFAYDVESALTIRVADGKVVRYPSLNSISPGPPTFSPAVTPDGRFVVTNDNRTRIKLFDIQPESEVLSWIVVDSADWVVTHRSGLFDASPNAMEQLYFVEGLNIIELSQLKDRYFEPRLWEKIMSGQSVRPVEKISSIDLPPRIVVGEVDDQGYLSINLTNEGGGIGEVNVLINGKEVLTDARPKGANPNAATIACKVYLANHKSLVKGKENIIAVKAWNKSHWVVSRGKLITYTTPGNDQGYQPAIHIITSGVSDYAGTELDLKYAAKDASDVSLALQLGAKNLFGIDKSFVYNLTTDNTPSASPTKANILKAFEQVSRTAHPLDVVVVYLSGHGVNQGGTAGDWYYITQEAASAGTATFSDATTRNTKTLSANELVELFKKIPALKQVLMIDACASGQVVDNLMTKKGAESNTLRALDRMRDRTGLHIITGCTADAVSYEASRYGQGVLTYSILEGMRGAALREEKFIDINRLFQYAHDRVPTLAEGLGGIQTPQVFSPQGSQSFDIGLLTDQQKKQIPIASIRPVYIRSTFMDDNQLEDALRLGRAVDESLQQITWKGTTSNIIFVDVQEYPEGCRLSGKYRKENGIIKLRMRKKCENKDELVDLEGSTVEELRDKIIALL